MVKLKSLLIVGVVLCTIHTVTNGGVIAANNQHEKFFKKLSEAEQRALMDLAIAHYYVPEDSNSTGLFPDYSFIKPKVEYIPKTLFTTMMNGGVPKRWMKQFMKWLRKDYKFTDQSFHNYANSTDDHICRNKDDAGNSDCITMEILQRTCCPFG